MVNKVISGGQNGVDIAGLVAAKRLGFETGGYMAFGFKTLEGCKPEYKALYGMAARKSASYRERTYANVHESDGTLRLAYDFESKGEICTLKAIKRYKKPYMDVNLDNPVSVSEVVSWLEENSILTLNIAGNSERTYPGIYIKALEYLDQLFYTICLKKENKDV